MNDIFKVASWEFTKGIKNKTFLFLTFIFPIIMLVVMAVVGYFAAQGGTGQDLYLGIVDKTDFMSQQLKQDFSEEEFRAHFLAIEENQIRDTLQENDYDGILYIPEDVMDSNQVSYYFKELSGLETEFVRGSLTDIIVNRRLVEGGYSPEQIKKMTANVNIDTKSLEEDDQDLVRMFLPFGLAFLMVFGVFMSGSILLQSIIKEKSNRIVEIILSSIKARTLMMGKVLGYALLSMVQIGIWITVGVLILLYFRPDAVSVIFDMKTLLMLVYIVFGFLIVASINAIIASSMKDAQSGNQSAGIFVLIPIIPVYFASAIINSPNGIVSRVLSFIPIFTPTTMMLRLGVSTPPAIEIIATIVLLIISSYLLMLLASKLFRIGMLMYGKSANFKEIVKWARSKDY
ncbi:MAG: ABC transporter permease [Bacillota bacterium]